MKRWYTMIRSCGTVTLIAAMFCLAGCREAEEAGEKTGEALEKAGEATVDAAEKVGDKIQDAADEVGDEF